MRSCMSHLGVSIRNPMPNLGGTIRNVMPHLGGTIQNFFLLNVRQEYILICLRFFDTRYKKPTIELYYPCFMEIFGLPLTSANFSWI